MRPLTSIVHARVVRGSGGGPDKTILNSAPYLEAAGYRFHCLYLRHPRDLDFGKLSAKATARGVRMTPIDDYGALDWRVPRRIRNATKDLAPYVWHGHDYKTNLLGLVGQRRQASRLVSTVHGWVHRTVRTPLYYAIDRWSLRRYDAVLCVSEDLLERCARAGVRRDRLSFIPNGVDTDEFQSRRSTEAAKQELEVPSRRAVVGAVGRLSGEKGFDLLIRAIADLIARGLDCEAWIVGDGDLEGSLRDLIRDLDLEDRVKLLGYRQDVRPLYEAMDVVAVSSLREGLPNVVLEAMAMGVPVVSTRVAGIPMAVHHRENGLIVEPGSSEALSRGLESLLSDAPLREAMGRAARRHAVDNLSFRNRMRAVLDVYRRLGLEAIEASPDA